jgi:hypothetical protein
VRCGWPWITRSTHVEHHEGLWLLCTEVAQYTIQRASTDGEGRMTEATDGSVLSQVVAAGTWSTILQILWMAVSPIVRLLGMSF